MPGVARALLAVRVTGVLTPRDPAGAYWSARDLLRIPTLVHLPTPGPAPRKYGLGALPLPPEAAPAMLGTDGDPARYWPPAPDLDGFHTHGLGCPKSAVAALESAPALRQARTFTDPGAAVSTGLVRH